MFLLVLFHIFIIIIIIIVVVNGRKIFQKKLFYNNFIYQKVFSQFARRSKNSDWSGIRNPRKIPLLIIINKFERMN